MSDDAKRAAELAGMERAHEVMQGVRDLVHEATRGTHSLTWDSASPVVPIELYGPEQRPVQSFLLDTSDYRGGSHEKWLVVLIPTTVQE